MKRCAKCGMVKNGRMEFDVFTTRSTPPFRFDTVGSFLRPKMLDEAKQAYANGLVSKEYLTKAEDRAILDFVRKQEKLGLKCVGDGEFRRNYWHMDFFWALDGIKRIYDESVPRSEFSDHYVVDTVGPIGYSSHPFLEHFKYLKSISSSNSICRLGIPSPTQLAFEVMRRNKQPEVSPFYGTDTKAMFSDISKTYIKFINGAYELGCRSIQLDDCAFCYLLSNDYFWNIENKMGRTRESAAEAMIELTNMVTDNIPKDITVVEHICVGPYAEVWELHDGYNDSSKMIFPYLHVDGIHLRMDKGPLYPIKYVPENTMVSLGIINTKSPEIEDRDYVIKSVKKAAEYHPLDKLGLSTQCGFASKATRPFMDENQAWDKLAFMKSVAQEIWGQ